MSRENVELISRIYELWTAKRSARDLISEELEYVNPDYAVEPGTRRGRASLAMVTDTYADFTPRVERLLDTAGDQVVVLARYTGSGRASGVPVEGEQGYVWTVRDGLAVRFEWYRSHREALEAAGLAQ